MSNIPTKAKVVIIGGGIHGLSTAWKLSETYKNPNDIVVLEKKDIAAGASGILYGDAGNDTFSIGASSTTLYGGADKDLLQTGTGNSNKIYGGADHDTISGTGVVTLSTLSGGAGNDIFTLTSGNFTTSKVVGGTGNDSVSFGNHITSTALASTYYFGFGDGTDSITFGANATGVIAGSLVIALDSQYGLTSGIGLSGTSGAETRTVTFGSGSNAGSIKFTNLFTATGSYLGASGVTFATVSTATITDLG